MGLRRHWMIVFAVAVCACSTGGGCASASTQDEETPLPMPAVVESIDAEARPYILDEQAGILVKFNPDKWSAIAPSIDKWAPQLFDKARAVQEPGAKDLTQDFVEAVSVLLGWKNALPSLSRERASFFVWSFGRNDPLNACITIGIPCPPEVLRSPRFGRLLLASPHPKELARQIQPVLEQELRGQFVMIPHDRFLRVEFSFGIRPNDQTEVDTMLAERRRELPEATQQRITPALRRFLSGDALISAYATFDSVRDWGRYYASQESFYAQELTSPQRRLGAFLTAVRYINLDWRDIPKIAEFEDLVLTLDAAPGGLDLVGIITHTDQGKSVAEKSQVEVELPRVNITRPVLEVEWEYNLTSALSVAKPPTWPFASRSSKYPPDDPERLPLSARVQAPHGALRAVADVVGGMPGLLACRVKVGPPSGNADNSLPFQMAGALLFDGSPKSRQAISFLRAKAKGMKGLTTTLATRDRGHLELRLALGIDSEKAFGPLTGVQGKPLSVSISPKAISPAEDTTGVLQQLIYRRMRLPVANTLTGLFGRRARLVEEFTRIPDMGIEVGSETKITTLKMRLGSTRVGEEKVETDQLQLVQPKRSCFDELRDISLPIWSGDGGKKALTAKRVAEVREQFLAKAKECAKAGEASRRKAQWAIEQFDNVPETLSQL